MSRNPPKYIKYQDYNIVKKSFDYTPTDEYDISFVNALIRHIRNTPEKELKLHDTFLQLKKLAKRHHCFAYYDKENCYKYINYWLNKTIRDSKYNITKENFKVFYDFKNADPDDNADLFDSISKLSYMDTDTFQKMEKLYDLYEYFTKLKESKDPTALCNNISFLTEKYESVFQECKDKDNNLCNMLKNLKSEIVKDKSYVNDICTKEAFDSFILKIYPPPPKEQNPPKTVQVQRRNYGGTHTRPTSSISSPQAHGTKTVETPAPTPVSASLPQEKGLEKPDGGESERTLSALQEQFPRPLPLLFPLPSLEQSEQSESSEPTGPMGPIGPEPEPESDLRQGQLQEQSHEQEQHLDAFRDPYFFRKDERYNFSEEGDPSAGSIQPPFNTETIMGTIKDAVSNVLEAVEPVPVLGVSGGMGALYLLFKYTPIGSLFRRNRRNNQNIPNFFDPRYVEQFSGYYPQYYNEGFSNYRMNIAYHPSSDELD